MTASPNASLFTYPRFMALNTEGYPLAGGKLYSYQAGTLTPQATYTDATLTVPNPNPIILDSFGTAAVWLSSNAYKFNLLDVNGVQQADFPIDNVTGYAQASAAGAATAVLADLASTAAGQGDALMAVVQPGAGAVPTNQGEFNSRHVYVADFLSAVQKTDILTGSPTLDCTTAVNAAIAYAATLKSPHLIFPSGVMLCAGTINCALPNNSGVEFLGQIISTVASTPATIAATALVAGTLYVISAVGTTNWTVLGAANNNPGTPFVATGAGTGSGTASLAVPAIILGSMSSQSNGLTVRGLSVQGSGAGATALNGSIGVLIMDQCASNIEIKQSSFFNVGVCVHSRQGNGGTSYTRVMLGFITDNVTNTYLTCYTGGSYNGYTNENSFFGGHHQHDVGFWSSYATNLLIDDIPSNVINNNKLFGVSLEANSASVGYIGASIGGKFNVLYQPRLGNASNGSYIIKFSASSQWCGIVGVGWGYGIANILDNGSNNYYQTQNGTFSSATPAGAGTGKAVFQGMSTYANTDHIFSALSTAKVESAWIDGAGNAQFNGLVNVGILQVGNPVTSASSNAVDHKIAIVDSNTGLTYYLLVSTSPS